MWFCDFPRAEGRHVVHPWVLCGRLYMDEFRYNPESKYEEWMRCSFFDCKCWCVPNEWTPKRKLLLSNDGMWSICSGGCLHGVSMGPNGVAPAIGGMTVSALPRLPTRSSNSSDHSEGATPARTGAPPPGRPSFPNDAYHRLPCPLLGILGKKTVFFELFGRFLSAFLCKSLPRNINEYSGCFRFSPMRWFCQFSRFLSQAVITPPITRPAERRDFEELLGLVWCIPRSVG